MRNCLFLITTLLILFSSCHSDNEPSIPNQPEWLEIGTQLDQNSNLFFSIKQVPKEGAQILLQQLSGTDKFIINFSINGEIEKSEIVTFGEESDYEYMHIRFWTDMETSAPATRISPECRRPYKYALITIEPNDTESYRHFSIGIFAYNNGNKTFGREFNACQPGTASPIIPW